MISLKLISVLLVFFVLPFPPLWSRSLPTVVTTAALTLSLHGGTWWVVIWSVSTATTAKTGFSASRPIIPVLAFFLGRMDSWVIVPCRCMWFWCCCWPCFTRVLIASFGLLFTLIRSGHTNSVPHTAIASPRAHLPFSPMTTSMMCPCWTPYWWWRRWPCWSAHWAGWHLTRHRLRVTFTNAVPTPLVHLSSSTSDWTFAPFAPCAWFCPSC